MVDDHDACQELIRAEHQARRQLRRARMWIIALAVTLVTSTLGEIARAIDHNKEREEWKRGCAPAERAP